MVNKRSSSLRRTPNVALMMPAPMRNTSVVSLTADVMGLSPNRLLSLARSERNTGVRCQHHIDTAPRLVVRQLPSVPAACGILRVQDIARAQDEMLPRSCLEFQRAAERDDELPGRRGMPGKSTALFRLLKGNSDCSQLAAQQITALACF